MALNMTYANYSFNATLPPDMMFDQVNKVTAISYLALFFVSATLNLTVLVTLLYNSRRDKSHVNRFIIHLCAADLVVTFITMPLEVRLNNNKLCNTHFSL